MTPWTCSADPTADPSAVRIRCRPPARWSPARRQLGPPSRRSQADRGAAAVELALVTPLLLLMLFGIIDFGRMLNAQITLTEAAREGARAVSLGLPADPEVTAIAGTVGTVTIDTTVCPDADPGADAVVTVSHAFQPVTPLGSFISMFGGDEDGAVTITATGVMPCLG